MDSNNNHLPTDIDQKNSIQRKYSIWAIVPAAGLGRRMQSDLPKQYLSINNKTILEHTLERLLSVKSITEVMVALDEDDHYFKTLACANNSRVTTAIGGKDRCDSVLSALMALQQKVSVNDRVLVHDAARCCILPCRIDELITRLKDDKVGGLLGVPVSDTLKQIDRHKKSTQTIDRSTVWAAQTPQLFPYDLLRQSLEKSLAAKQMITDEASAIEYSGFKPQIVMGHYDNIKVTHPNDIAIASAIMNYQSISIPENFIKK